MTLDAFTSTTPAPSLKSTQRYNYIESDGAEQMLREVAVFRPGDYTAPPDFTNSGCDDPGPGCLLDGMDANPYLASLFGFAIIPFIMSIWLCFCYTFCCCPCWCICDQCGKKCCCCHRIMKDPIEDKNLVKQWTPFAFLAACMIIIVWACIEGIVNNSEMHDHIFGNEQGSVKYGVNHLFGEVITRFEAIEPTAEYIIDVGVGILDDVFNIIENTTDSIGGTIDDLYDALDIISANYSGGVNLTSTFRNPFNTTQKQEFTIECPYCSTIAETAENIKDQLNSSVGGQLGQIDQLINQTKQLLDAKDQITNLTAVFRQTLNEIINQSYDINDTANGYIDLAAEFDKQYREQPAMIFFCIPMTLLVFVILGVVLKNKWCFKCEWFCAMYCCGVPIMLLSWPFIFFAVLWGDLCVRLDDFEQNMENSQIGQLAGLDDKNSSYYESTQMALDLVNTCFTGGSPLELFNLSSVLDWDDFREQMDEQLDVDITGMLETQDLSSFQTEMDTLTVAEFDSEVDSYIAEANNVGYFCGCGRPGVPFTKQNLYGDGSEENIAYCANYTAPNMTGYDPILEQYYDMIPTYPTGLGFSTTQAFEIPDVNITGYESLSPYWKNVTVNHPDGFECFNAFLAASAAIQVEFTGQEQADDKINAVKKDADRVFDIYDNIYGIAVDVEDDISSISCLGLYNIYIYIYNVYH